MDIYLGVDLGGTEIKAATVTPDGAVQEVFGAETQAARGRDAVLQRIEDLIGRAVQETRPHTIRAAGVTFPGVLDMKTGTTEFMTNFTRDWGSYPVRDDLAKRTHLPVSVINDARAATVGEHTWGAGKPYHDFVVITVGTGIGGGIVIDDRLYFGSRGVAGEIGHMTVDPGGPMCLCGNRGCMEAVASGTAIARVARAAIQEGDTQLAELSGSDAPSPHQVADAAEKGSEGAKTIFAQAGRWIGVGLGSLVCALNPQAFVIGGGVARAGDLLLEPIRREIERRTVVFPSPWGDVEVVPSPLGGEAGAVGAAAWAMRQLKEESAW